MGILSRPRFLPQQRLDLEDVNALLSALRTDSKLYTKQFLASQNLIYKGFSVTGIGLKSATVNMADATFIIPQNTSDFSWFTSSPTEDNIIVPDADLADGVRNYLELQILTENNTPLTKAFWDPEANSGSGSEFNQLVETITDLTVRVIVSTGGFSGNPDRIPLAIIDVDGSGDIKTILDRRNLFGRLATPANIDYRYTWGTKVEPAYSLALNGVSGTFEEGETITIGTETAKVVVGGTSSISFNVPTGINFFPGDTVTGQTSGATGTINTVAEAFSGVDKSLGNQKSINDALMTEIALVKGTRFWWENAASSIGGILKNIESVLVQNTATAKFHWSGTELSITDDNPSPGDDVLGFIRVLGRIGDLSLSREDGTGGTSVIPIADGEVLFVKIPSSGARTYSGTGSSDTNFQVVDIESYESSEESYWLAYREGSRLYIRGYGELEPGEDINIGDPELEEILAQIADNQVKSNQDRNLKLLEGGTWSLGEDGETLTFSSNARIQVPGVASDRNNILSGSIVLPNPNSCAYVEINRSAGAAADLSITVQDEASVVLNDNLVIIARKTSEGVIVGTSSFLLKPGESLELDGALAEINRYMGQLKIKRHESDSDKARINPSDSSLLNGNTLSQMAGDLLLSFSGAVIDFTTGTITKEDGSTALGTNFAPQVIPSGEYFWYGVSLIPGNVTADNLQEATVQIDFAESSNSVQASAVKPVITGQIKLGAIQVRNNSGDIEVVDLKPLGVGSGSGGSGTGDANSFVETLKNRLLDSVYDSVTPVIAATDQDDLINTVVSTASYSPADKNYVFSSIGQVLATQQLLDPSFLEEARQVNRVQVIVQQDLDATVDENMTVEVSRNGGNEYQEVTMERVSETDTFYGTLDFEVESSNTVLEEQSNTDQVAPLNESSQQLISQSFTLAETSEIRYLTVGFVKTGSPLGNVFISLREDNAGDPGDVIAETAAIPVSSIFTGSATKEIARTVLLPGTYHIVVRTDEEYKDSFVASTTELALNTQSTETGAQINDGTSWSDLADGLFYSVAGFELDLRVRITSSVADLQIVALGVLYGEPVGKLATGVKSIETVTFNAVADNFNEFNLTGFIPDPDLLTVYHVQSGQVFRVGAFSLQGQKVIFPVDQFNNGGVEAVVTLIFDQTRGGAFDNSDVNALLLSGNHLGSTDTTIDRSTSGRGIFLRRPDGTLRELVINDDDEIEIWSVD